MAVSDNKRHGVYWLDPAYFPFTIGVVLTEADWDTFHRYLKIKDVPYHETAGLCSKLENDSGDVCILIAIRDWQDKSVALRAGIAAHECKHAFDYLCEHIGEREPSAEFSCYTIQNFVMGVMDAFEKETKRQESSK